MGETDHWKRQRVFVTGATGLLGSAVVAELIARGADVTCLVRDWVPASALISSGVAAKTNVVSGDLLDLQLLIRALNEYEIGTVLHLGAQSIVGTAARSPISTFESNIRGTWNLLEACRLNNRLIQRVVVASSDKAYGIHERLPYSENAPLVGRFPYDVSKSCADLIALSYFHTYRTPVVVTRCGNLWGPGDLNYNRLIPGTIRSALLDESPIIRSDGTFRRDYFFVRDAVEHLRADGVDVSVVSPVSFRHFGLAYGHGIAGNLKRAPWKLALVPLFLASYARAARTAARDADLVHAHWLPSALPALATGRPFVVQLWGTDVELARRVAWASRLLLRRARLDAREAKLLRAMAIEVRKFFDRIARR